ncbi:MAG: polysaccharide biosynthesis protein [Muribaculaceae bacterium]|nr:polysaccharide biosynthesis protein [Muribaculaceae bacterium]
MFNPISKLSSYLKSTVVLAIDVLVSLIASICVLLFVYALAPNIHSSQPFILKWIVAALGSSVLAFYVTRSYRLIIRYSTLKEFGKISLAVFVKDALLLLIMLCVAATNDDISTKFVSYLVLFDFFVTLGALVTVRVLMLVVYQLLTRRIDAEQQKKRVLVYGTGGKAASLVTRLRNSKQYEIVGFLKYGPEYKNQILAGLPIYYFVNVTNVNGIRRKLGIEGILFAHQHEARDEKSRLIEYCQETGLKMYIAPSIDEMRDGKLPNSGIRKVKIEDLLGRSEIKVSMDEIKAGVRDKTILVTGAAGSIGSELCRQLARLGIKELIMFDNAETPLHNVRLEFEEKFSDLKFTPIIGDVRQKERLDYVFRTFQPQIVFHAAAYKHVPLMEENPCEAVRVNVVGSRNVADKCIEYDVDKMVMISTDKAVNPTNIMGCTKRLAEIYVQSLGLAIESGEIEGHTQFVTTRFGNVLGSNGSVIPRFAEQIEKGGPVTVTDPEIRRFFMTIPEACRLVMEAATMVTETRIFVFDMGTPIKIADLARNMIQLAGYEVDKDIKIEYTGLRPGEKLYEEVLATKENTIPTDHERIFVAKVRKYRYDDISRTIDELDRLSRAVIVPDMVILMKQTVPEFKSKHSEFEKYDR